ncbi:MAG: prolipoprotein diacylglyceryl transferase [Myxococcales bacterium]|nr:prolipoprotein diacylglyceryl transferase [Myxococcales bacterium]
MLPVLFHLPGGHPVYAYGVMLGLSLVVGFQVTVRLAQRDAGVDRDLCGNACLAAVLAGVVGARLSYVAINRELVEDVLGRWWNIQSGGLMGIGGLVAGFAAASAYLRAKRAPVLAVADAATPAIAIGIVFTRIGSYLYGSDFGVRLDDGAPELLRTLGTFPRWQDSALFGAPAFAYHVDRFGLARDALAAYPVHPVQLYAALFGALLLGLSVVFRRSSGFSGQAFLRFAVVYGVGTFLLAYLRADPDRGMAFGFTASQLASLVIIPVAVIAHSQLKRANSGSS